MYSKQEASQLRKEFWTVFGQYMQPVLSSDGEKINWINFKTGVKDVFFKMNADNKKASIDIELHHADSGIRQLYYEQFVELKNFLHAQLDEEWTWMDESLDEHGKHMSRIYSEVSGVSIFKREDWPKLISFFKQRIIALDEFWSVAKHQFDALH